MEKNRRNYVGGKEYACGKGPQAQFTPEAGEHVPEEGLTKAIKIEIRSTQFLPLAGFKMAQAFSVFFISVYSVTLYF